MRRSVLFGFYLLSLAMLMESCTMKYSFTGASIPPEVKTISIHYLKNTAPLVKPTLSQQLTDELRNRFTTQTSLTPVNQNGDFDISGEITNYATSPVAIQGNQTAAMNRLTVTISIRFVNKFDEKQNYETSFSRYVDYPSSQALASVENQILEEIIGYLVDDVFNKTAVNW
ncbi:MAG TPA: LptE family protein [Bacteroidales bacterium]|mgnify:FL=1|nr:LptE family protein [Bacteroidales bacterium]